MNRYTIVCSVAAASGWQEYTVDAETEEEALAKFEKKGGTFVDEEVLVDDLGEPEVTNVITI